jgi:hypothetical protein
MYETPETKTLEVSDASAASVQKTENRVTLDSIKAKVKGIEFINPVSAAHVTLAFVTMNNGFTLVGKSAPADPANFDADKGKAFAYEDALRQAWAHEGYLLCEKLAA